mmetsp:Transcript_15259/g.22917  ORF Transcript_15259/g.22917 Transcript_15259/m.22917 type:complete len:2020 (+) Transcript_15259:40-6099(+)
MINTSKEQGRCIALCSKGDEAYAMFIYGQFVELASLIKDQRYRFKIAEDHIDEYVMTIWDGRVIVCFGTRLVAVDLAKEHLDVLAESIWSRSYVAVGLSAVGENDTLCVSMRSARKGLVARLKRQENEWSTSELTILPQKLVGLETPCYALSDESQTIILDLELQPRARIHGQAMSSVGLRGLLTFQDNQVTWWDVPIAAAPVPLRSMLIPHDMSCATTRGPELWFIANGKLDSLNLTSGQEHSVPGSEWSQVVSNRKRVWARKKNFIFHEIVTSSNESVKKCKDENFLEMDLDKDWESILCTYKNNTSQAAQIATNVTRYEFSGPTEATEVLMAVARGLEYLVKNTQKDQGHLRDALVVVRDATDSIACFERLRKESGNQSLGWGRAWLQFRRSDAIDVAAQAAESGAIRSVRELWLRYIRPKCITKVALGSAFVTRCLLRKDHLADDNLLQLAVRCIFLDDVLDTLDSISLARLAAWAKTIVERICLDEHNFERALKFGQRVLTLLRRRLAVATESRWLLMSEHAYTEEHRSDLSELQRLVSRLDRLVELKTRHGLTLGSLDSYDEKASVAALLERVREPSFLEAEIDHHVRPACQAQGISADSVLASYATSIIDYDRAAQVILCGIKDQRQRARATLDLMKRCEPPYPASVLKLVSEYEEICVGQDDNPAHEEILYALRDAVRLTALADVATRAGCEKSFDPTDRGHARRLLRRIVHRATRSKTLDWLNDVKQLERAYPATISNTDAALLFFHFVLDSMLTQSSDQDQDAPHRLRSVILALVPRGQFRQSARRDMLLTCLSQLDEESSNRLAAARLGVAIAEDLAIDNAPVLGNDEFLLVTCDHQDDDIKTRSQRALAEIDALNIDLMSRLAALYEEFELSDKVTPSLLSDDDQRFCLLESESRALASLAITNAASRMRLERLAELLEAPPGYVAATLIYASDGYQQYVDELWRDFEASPTSRATALRSLASRLLYDKNINVLENHLEPKASSRRAAALRALTQAASLETDLIVLRDDATRLEGLRFLDATASRLAGAANEDDEDRLLILGGAKAAHGSPLERLFEGVACLVADSSRKELVLKAVSSSSEVEEGIRALVSAGAWRLAGQALMLSLAIRNAVVTCGGRTLFGKHLENRLAYFHDAGHRQSNDPWLARQFQAEYVAGLAASSGGVHAYRKAVGAVSLSDLDALADLARLGATVAQRLNDKRLRDATASLVDDAEWWGRLRDWHVAFNHTKLRFGGGIATSGHAHELLAPLLDDDIMSPVDHERIRAAFALSRRYDVPAGECAAAVTVRLLARGLRGRGHHATAILVKSSLQRIPDPQRRRTVLRAAIGSAQPTAYDRIELAVKLLLALEQEYFAENQISQANGGSPFAAPSAERLSKWRQLLRWLRSVKLDATAALGSQGSRLLGEGVMLGFHELVESPTKTLERILIESTAPRLARIARLCGLEPGALWIRLAERHLLKHQPKKFEDAWRCLERAAERNLAAAAIAIRKFLENGLVSDAEIKVEWTRRAVCEIADKWINAAPRLAAAHETRAALENLRIVAARQAVAEFFFIDSDQDELKKVNIEITLEASELLEILYHKAATTAAKAPRQSFLSAAQRAHCAARLLARFEARDIQRGDELAEAARARLARAWIFDDCVIDDDQNTTEKSIFTPSIVELGERAFEITAAKIAFVLSARDFGEKISDQKLSALELRLLPIELRSIEEKQIVENETSAVDLLIDLTTAHGDYLDESSVHRDEAGRRYRLSASARLRALGAAAVLGPSSSLRAALERHGFECTLPKLAQRLKLVAELTALRLPILPENAEASAAVNSLLADHGHDTRLAPRLLPLLATLLLDNETQIEKPDVWRNLLEHFARHNLWRPLLKILLRLSNHTWVHTWRGDGLRDLWLTALRKPANELLESRKTRPLWDRNANKQRAIYKKSQQVPSDDLVLPIFQDILALIRTCPHFVRVEDKIHIVTALKSTSSVKLGRLSAAFEENSDLVTADDDPYFDYLDDLIPISHG